MKKEFLVSTIVFLWVALPGWVHADKKEISKCHDHINPLHLKRERVAELDGIWGLFEKNRELQDHSVNAILLDRKVNSIIFHLEYLCDTLYGIPMNEVARYVRDGIKKRGEEGFRKHLIILGKSEAEIDIWYEFLKFSLANKERTLEISSIKESIKKSASHIETYKSLAEQINNQKIDDSIPNKVKALAGEIDGLFKNDKYLSQALAENANIPYVDINESTGGS
ncbi:MAG: hypothetical protein VW455_07885 [Nitrospinota bacterium]